MAIPDSFDGLTSTDIGAQLTKLKYYSFVPMTTLGYGVLTLIKLFARTVAKIEANVGQLSVAMLEA